MAAWGETLKEEEDSQQEKVVEALMARSKSESNLESIESLSQLKDTVHGLSIAKVVKLLFAIMNECKTVTVENCMLKDVCSEFKKDVRMLEQNKLELEHVNKVLKCEKLKEEEEGLALCKDLDALKDLINTREKEFNSDLTGLNSESRDLKLKVESLVSENDQLLGKAHKVESNLVQNKRYDSSSEVYDHKVKSNLVQNRRQKSSSNGLNLLNTHHSRNKRGLGFVNRPVTRPVNKKYAGLQENIICFHCGKTGHYRFACPLRKKKKPWRETHCMLNKYGFEKMT